jgi:hypothetical protein
MGEILIEAHVISSFIPGRRMRRTLLFHTAKQQK